MMSETSAGHSATTNAGGGHETVATAGVRATTAPTGGISNWREFAIEYETAIAASIGASISAVVG
jgi:hypothetical protein